MKRLLSLLLLVILLFSTVSCADLLADLPPQTPPVNTPVVPDEPSDPTPPDEPSKPTDPEVPSDPQQPILPTPPPIVQLESDVETPEAVAASYRLVTEGQEYTLYALYRSEDGRYWSMTREGAYTVTDGVYTLATDGKDDLYGAYFDGVFYLTDEGASTLPSPLRGGDGVTDTEITPANGNVDFGYRDLANGSKGDAMQTLYRAFLDAAERFALSSEIVTTEHFYIAEVNYASLGLTKDEAIAVWKIFTLENPSYYWLSSSVFTSSKEIYLCIDETYAGVAERTSLDTHVSAMRQSFLASIREGMSDLEIALLLHDFILSRIDYAYDGAGQPESAIWAHNIVGVATGRGGVCEAYAKTFQYLGTLAGLDILTVSGDAGEPHAWNLLWLDGAWYGVDVTWDDTGEATHSYVNFGLSATSLSKEHIADTFSGVGADYLYRLPTLSEADLQLLTLYKGETCLGIFASIDHAFLAMSDEQGDYRIELFQYAYEGRYANAYPVIRHTILSATTPKVKSIEITGAIFDLDGYRKETPFVLCNLEGLTLLSELRIEDACLTTDLAGTPGLLLNGNGLVLTGESASSTLLFVGSKEADGSSIGIDLERTATLNSYVSACVFVDNGKLILTGGAEIESLVADTVTVAPTDATAKYDYRLPKLGSTTEGGTLTLTLLDHARVYVGAIHRASSLTVEYGFATAEAFPTLVFTETPTLPLVLTVDGNVDENTAAYPTDIQVPLATFPTDMTMKNLSVYFVSWYSKGGVQLPRTNLYTIDENGKLQTIAYNIVENDFVVLDGTLLLYIGDASEVILPDTVTAIAPMAFACLDFVTSVAVGEGVCEIGSSAFLRCPNLSGITLPKSLTKLSYAFADTLAESVGVTYLGTAEEFTILLAKNYIGILPEGFAVTCTDGAGLTSTPFMQNPSYPGVYITEVTELLIHEGKSYAKHYLIQYKGSSAKVTAVFVAKDGTFFTSPVFLGTVEFFYYTNLALYAIVDGDATYYLAEAESGALVFTDRNGNPTDITP